MTKPKHEKPTDSVKHHEERLAQLHQESDVHTQLHEQQKVEEAKRKAQHEEAARTDEEKTLKTYSGLAKQGDTLGMIHDRIREMRAEKKPDPVPPPPLTEKMKEQLAAEQEMGRRMVAKNEAEQAANRERMAQYEAEERARTAQLRSVHQPNPGMNEPFPVNKATFK